MNTRCILALYSQTVISRRSRRSCIIAPSGEIVAACSTKGDELAIARCDLDLCLSYQRTTFNFALHRRPQTYGLITQRRGAIAPAT